MRRPTVNETVIYGAHAQIPSAFLPTCFPEEGVLGMVAVRHFFARYRMRQRRIRRRVGGFADGSINGRDGATRDQYSTTLIGGRYNVFPKTGRYRSG